MPSALVSDGELVWRQLIAPWSTLRRLVNETCTQTGVLPASFYYLQKKLGGNTQPLGSPGHAETNAISGKCFHLRNNAAVPAATEDE